MTLWFLVPNPKNVYLVIDDLQMLRDAGFDEVIAEDRTDQVLHKSTIILYPFLFFLYSFGLLNLT